MLMHWLKQKLIMASFIKIQKEEGIGEELYDEGGGCIGTYLV